MQKVEVMPEQVCVGEHLSVGYESKTNKFYNCYID
jgi:hypothetical protein